MTGGVVGGLIGLAIGAGAFELAIVNSPDLSSAILGAAAGAGVGMWALAPLMPYLFNSPEMHLWHHAKELPEERRHGVNFGLTLAAWDYLFGTNYQPYHEAEMPIGFAGMEEVPEGFAGQVTIGLPGQ